MNFQKGEIKKMKKIKFVMAIVLSATMLFNTAGLSYASVAVGEMDTYKNSVNSVLDYNEVDIIYSELDSEYNNYYNSEGAVIAPTDLSGLTRIITLIIAEHGATYGAGYAIGIFCKNHKIPYKVGQGALFAACSPLLPTIRAAVALGFDNGYHSR